MDSFADNFLNWSVAADYMPELLAGMWLTLKLAVIVNVGGLMVGTLLALLRSLRVRPASFLVVLFADVMRALPPLMLMVVAYFGLPYFGMKLNGFAVASMVLAAVLASFTEELLWAGLGAIARGQYEAARSTGLTFLQMMRYVVLPQAFRLILAPLTSRIIATTKNTALASVVAVPELLSQANAAQGYSGNASPLTVASIGYLVILLPMVIVARRLERVRKLA
ncbi:polar amino acid transport system permease protein [Bradyrhizobium sp. F1.4.3]|uniref:amino acid ABC transporter permease n=1 Tax=Bradyrhizobium sp. F1.4.3 TaxID=3156356 RepID=UPI003394F245